MVSCGSQPICKQIFARENSEGRMSTTKVNTIHGVALAYLFHKPLNWITKITTIKKTLLLIMRYISFFLIKVFDKLSLFYFRISNLFYLYILIITKYILLRNMYIFHYVKRKWESLIRSFNVLVTYLFS
jgi:hypothetical protein